MYGVTGEIQGTAYIVRDVSLFQLMTWKVMEDFQLERLFQKRGEI